MIKIKILIFFITTVACLPQTDYCNRTLCGGHKHIACRNSTQFAATCKNPKYHHMTPQLKNFIVAKHNTYRNLIASGKQSHFPTAARMLKMKWNNHLARFAELNVLQCIMKHDECRNTNEYRYCGQNLGVQRSIKRISTESTVNNLIAAWYDEHTQATKKDINKFRRDKLRTIGHFTGMIQDKAGEIGCAIVKYQFSTWFNLLFACNYSFMNVNGKPVYEKGPTCSKCIMGCDKKYSGLCNGKEKVIAKP